jgi:polar amino acid transport system substrate-binding protein
MPFHFAGARAFYVVTVLTVAALAAAPAVAQTVAPSVFRWAGDPEGGAPFVEADPADPRSVVGFDVEVAQLIARGLGRAPQFIQVGFASIDQSIARGDADIGLSGVEDTPARRTALLTTHPYYEFQEVLSVREADRGRLTRLQDLAGRRVGTLGGTMAYEILLQASRQWGLEPLSYDDDVHPFEDLLLGRLDAVLLDDVLAARRARQMPGIAIQPDAVATGHYVGVLARERGDLRDRVNDELTAAMQDGSLEAIFRKWGVWNDRQPLLYARLLAGAEKDPGGQ